MHSQQKLIVALENKFIKYTYLNYTLYSYLYWQLCDGCDYDSKQKQIVNKSIKCNNYIYNHIIEGYEKYYKLIFP